MTEGRSTGTFVVNASSTCRRVGNIYYTRRFAEAVYKEMILSNAKVKSMIPRILLQTAEAGSSLGNLFSASGRDWWPLVEGVFTAPPVVELYKGLLREATRNDVMESISVDATLRCCLRIVGQAPYRCPPATRAQDPHSSCRLLLTIPPASSLPSLHV